MCWQRRRGSAGRYEGERAHGPRGWEIYSFMIADHLIDAPRNSRGLGCQLKTAAQDQDRQPIGPGADMWERLILNECDMNTRKQNILSWHWNII